MNNQPNVLYFQAMGWDYPVNESSDIGNYRIRSAFTNNDGVNYYVEFFRSTKYKGNKVLIEWALSIDSIEIIEDDIIKKVSHPDLKKLSSLTYTKETITKWINTNLNCSFDTIEVLDEYYEYHVREYHVSTGREDCHLSNNHIVNHELASKRRKAFEEYDQTNRTLLGSKYRVCTLMGMDNRSITVKCNATDQALARTGIPRLKKIEVE